MMKRAIIAGLGALLLAGAMLEAPQAQAGSGIEGTWRTEKGWLVKLFRCGGAYCGKVVGGTTMVDKNNPDPKLRQRKVVGIRLLWGLKESGGVWKGKLYNPKDGKTYTGSIKPVSANALKLSGCILGGLLCRSQTWKRAQ